MKTAQLWKRIISTTLVLAAMASAGTARAAFNATLQGQDFGNTNWVGGPLDNWAEQDNVPCRVKFTGGPASNRVITVNFDHYKGGVPAIQNLVSFSNSANVVIATGPTLSAPSGSAIWTYTFTVHVTNASEGAVYFFAHLSAGSHAVTGGSMSLGGSPSLGTMGIKTPVNATGSPDLSTVKTGPTNANPGQVITYGVSYNVAKPGDGATGTLLIDKLPNPATLTFVSATGPYAVLGDEVTWNLGNLKAGAKGRFLVTAVVASNAINNSTFQNTATITSAQDDPVSSNNSSSIVTRVVGGCIPPVVNAPPLSGTNVIGTALTLDVVANGTNPLRYQWRKNATPITDATNASYTIPSIIAGDAGTYDVIVSNACGSVTSAGAVITVVLPPDCSVSGSTNVCPSATGLVYTNAGAVNPAAYNWQIAGNGSIVGSTSNASVTVNAGASGTFTLQSTIINTDLEATNTCSLLVTIGVTSPPIIGQLPGDQTASAGAGCQAAVPDFSGGLSATDACGSTNVTVAQSPTAGTLVGLGATPVALIVSDSFGNSTTGTVHFTVADTTAPAITQCAGNASADADGNGQASVPDLTGGVSATDACSGGNLTVSQFPVAGTLVGIGQHSITLSVADEAGNTNQCVATFTVNDTTPPVVTACAGNASANADANCQASVPDLTGDVSAADNSGNVTVTQDPTAGTLVSAGTHIITFTVSDGSGNSTNCTATFTVTDTTPPAITQPPAEVTANTDAGESFASNVNLGPGPSATDACGIASVQNDAPSTFPAGTNTVVWTVTDVNGNTATATQLVVIVDNELPVITCPANITTNLDAGVCSLTEIDLGSPVSSDNVGIASVSSNAPAVFHVGTNEVVWTATDFDGNEATCAQLVVLVDATAPAIAQAPANQQAEAGANCETPVPDFTGGIVATDDCSTNSLSVSQSPAPGTLVGLGQTVVTLTVTDESGNSTETNVTFTVVDTTAPAITQCAADAEANADENGEAAVPDLTGDLSATDGCSSGNLTVTQSPAAGTLVGPGPHTVTLIVTDESGNSNQCVATFTVNDATAPVITCPGDIVVTAPSGSNSVSGVDLGTPVASDNSGTVNVSNDAPASFPIGDTVVTWTADDGNGNTATCQQTVTVVAGNGTPAAHDDNYTVAEDDVLDVAAPGVLGNDTDDGTLTAVLVSSTTHGALTLRADGSFTYVPEDNFNGTDTFTYKANDGTFDSGVATVTITVTPVGGAGDIDLYAKTAAFKLNRAAGNRDTFRIKGKINPRGAKINLAGATMQISVNGTNLFAPVTLDATGAGSATVGSVKIKAKLKSASGLYSFTLGGGNLRDAIGLADANGSGVTALDVVLTIVEADLDITTVRGLLETPYLSAAGKFSKGKFVFKTNRTLTGVFNATKTTATQLGNGAFKIAAKGVIENEGGSAVVPTGPITAYIGDAVVTIPGPAVKATMNNVTRTFKFSATNLADTGIPLMGEGAPTVHRLPIMLAVPSGNSTNIFETIIELKRPDGAAKKWSR